MSRPYLAGLCAALAVSFVLVTRKRNLSVLALEQVETIFDAVENVASD